MFRIYISIAASADRFCTRPHSARGDSAIEDGSTSGCTSHSRTKGELRQLYLFPVLFWMLKLPTGDYPQNQTSRIRWKITPAPTSKTQSLQLCFVVTACVLGRFIVTVWLYWSHLCVILCAHVRWWGVSCDKCHRERSFESHSQRARVRLKKIKSSSWKSTSLISISNSLHPLHRTLPRENKSTFCNHWWHLLSPHGHNHRQRDKHL